MLAWDTYLDVQYPSLSWKGHSLVANFKYLWYVIRHKYFVAVASIKLKVHWKLVINHDRTKFTKHEWRGYVNKFYRNCLDDWHDALQHHYENNPHHWQFWIIDDKPHEIPEYFVREMIADWMGANRSITGGWNHLEWYMRNRNVMVLHPRTRVLVEALMPGFDPVRIKPVIV